MRQYFCQSSAPVTRVNVLISSVSRIFCTSATTGSKKQGVKDFHKGKPKLDKQKSITNRKPQIRTMLDVSIFINQSCWCMGSTHIKNALMNLWHYVRTGFDSQTENRMPLVFLCGCFVGAVFHFIFYCIDLSLVI